MSKNSSSSRSGPASANSYMKASGGSAQNFVQSYGLSAHSASGWAEAQSIATAFSNAAYQSGGQGGQGAGSGGQGRR